MMLGAYFGLLATAFALVIAANMVNMAVARRSGKGAYMNPMIKAGDHRTWHQKLLVVVVACTGAFAMLAAAVALPMWALGARPASVISWSSGVAGVVAMIGGAFYLVPTRNNSKP